MLMIAKEMQDRKQLDKKVNQRYQISGDNLSKMPTVTVVVNMKSFKNNLVV